MVADFCGHLLHHFFYVCLTSMYRSIAVWPCVAATEFSFAQRKPVIPSRRTGDCDVPVLSGE